MKSGATSLRVRFQSANDSGLTCSGDTRSIDVSSLCPEDRFRLNKKHQKFNYFGVPAENGSPLAVVLELPELSLCSADELKVKARSQTEKYKRGKTSMTFLVIGAWVAKQGALKLQKTWHVRLPIF